MPVYSKDVRLPVQLQRAMAAEAEAAREARAKVIKIVRITEISAWITMDVASLKIRGCSHITSYVFGVSDTPWWLCPPVVIF